MAEEPRSHERGRATQSHGRLELRYRGFAKTQFGVRDRQEPRRRQLRPGHALQAAFDVGQAAKRFGFVARQAGQDELAIGAVVARDEKAQLFDLGDSLC